MNAKNSFRIILMGLLILLGFVFSAAAQNKQADNMQMLLEQIHADKKLIVAQNMELTDAESKSFWPVYNQYQDELFLLRVRTARLIKDYAAANEKMTNETAKKLLDEYMTIEALRLKLRQVYLPKFRKVLPETKVVRYYQIENKIQAALMYELAENIPLVKMAK
jgi:hypothetical protein